MVVGWPSLQQCWSPACWPPLHGHACGKGLLQGQHLALAVGPALLLNGLSIGLRMIDWHQSRSVMVREWHGQWPAHWTVCRYTCVQILLNASEMWPFCNTPPLLISDSLHGVQDVCQLR